MILRKEMYCIASRSFPLKFYRNGYEIDELDIDVLRNKEGCEYELETYDEPELYQILKVKVTYEF